MPWCISSKIFSLIPYSALADIYLLIIDMCTSFFYYVYDLNQSSMGSIQNFLMW